MLMRILTEADISMSYTMIELGGLPISDKPEPFHALLEYAPRARVYSFEVDPAVCDHLNQRAPRGLRYFPTAIGSVDGKRAFYETRHPMCSSLFRPDERWADAFHGLDVTRLSKSREIETITLDSFARREGIGAIDFIKMDIQGGELDALRGASTLLRDALFIVSEVEFVPMYIGQPLFGEIDAFLRDRGFALHKFLGMCGRMAKPVAIPQNPYFATQHMWADAVFIRDLFRAAEYSREQLLKLAVFLEMYGSPDLALFMVQKADERGGPALAGKYMKVLSEQPVAVA
jgi:FkbM family methyltransferase